MAAHVNEVHLGVRPYICDHLNPSTNESCGLGYQTQNKLQNHINAVHGEIPRFYCSMCSTTLADGETVELVAFVSFNEMQQHKQTYHSTSAPALRQPRQRQPKEKKEKPLPKARKPRNHYSAIAPFNDMVNLLTGTPTIAAETACLRPSCSKKFVYDDACALHCSLVHGMDNFEISEAFKEREANIGGTWWYSRDAMPSRQNDDPMDADDAAWFRETFSKLRTESEADIVIDPELVA